jgi:enamine deaminase RidA (YjgF/YER057c/UK114 family)
VGLLSSLKAEIGDLNRVRRVVKLLSMVNATDDFTQHPQVANGCSDIFVQLWGENGKHGRSAVGMASLPGNAAVEVEAIVEVE